VAILDWGMDPATAFALPHIVNRNGATDVETGGEAYIAGLEALGHTTNARNLNSGLHGILIKNGKLLGAADPRREGKAMGQ